MIFSYSPSSQLNGILRYLQNKHKEEYFNLIQCHASSIFSHGYEAVNAINFETTSQWVSSATDSNARYTFCFANHSVSVLGYEIHPGGGECRMKNWNFAGSNVPDVWEFGESKNYAFGVNEVKYFEWNHGPFRCFQITKIDKSQCNSYQSDIVYIELYGKLNELNSHICETKNIELILVHTTIYCLILSFSIVH